MRQMITQRHYQKPRFPRIYLTAHSNMREGDCDFKYFNKNNFVING